MPSDDVGTLVATGYDRVADRYERLELPEREWPRMRWLERLLDEGPAARRRVRALARVAEPGWAAAVHRRALRRAGRRRGLAGRADVLQPVRPRDHAPAAPGRRLRGAREPGRDPVRGRPRRRLPVGPRPEDMRRSSRVVLREPTLADEREWIARMRASPPPP